jgi:hypothetical protein
LVLLKVKVQFDHSSEYSARTHCKRPAALPSVLSAVLYAAGSDSGEDFLALPTVAYHGGGGGGCGPPEKASTRRAIEATIPKRIKDLFIDTQIHLTMR